MKKTYSDPIMTVSVFSSENIVTASGGYTSGTTVTAPPSGSDGTSLTWDDFSISLVG